MNESEIRMFDVNGLAKYVGMSPKTIRRYVESGRLPVVKIGRSLRFDRQVIDRCLNGGFLLTNNGK